MVRGGLCKRRCFFVVVLFLFSVSSWHSLSLFFPTPDVRGGKPHTAASAASSLTREPHCRAEFPTDTLSLHSNPELWSTTSPWDFLHVLECCSRLHSLFLPPSRDHQTFPMHSQVYLYFSLDTQHSASGRLLPWFSRGKNHCVA